MEKNKWSENVWSCLKGDLVYGLAKAIYKDISITDFEKQEEKHTVLALIKGNDFKNIDKINTIDDIENNGYTNFNKYKNKTLEIINLAKKILRNENFNIPTITFEQCEKLLKKYSS